jgi:hypothetical protein
LVIEKIVSAINGLLQACLPPGGIDGLGFADVQHAEADGRIRVKQSNREKFIFAIVDDREFAGGGVAVLLANAVAEDPRMAGAQLRFGYR